MNPLVTPDLQEILDVVHYRPSVSIILPFDPKMGLKAEIAHALELAADRVSRELRDQYPEELSNLVNTKLRRLIRDLNFNTHKKSVAIYVSPVFEKVLYLDVPVEEKIIVDESFEIRDLVYSKKQLHKYLVLLLSQTESRMFLGDVSSFIRIVSDRPENSQVFQGDPPERVGNFSDPEERKQLLMEKFLRHTDNSLDIVLQAYRLPLFVMGTEKTVGHFRKLTKHSHAVVEYIYGNFEEASIPDIRQKLAPHIEDWKKVLQQSLMNTLEEAADRQKLAVGMNAVWREANQHRGRLLVVEKDYMFPAEPTDVADNIDPLPPRYNKYSYIKDAVDDVIEKVLQYGGDVEFVDNGVLAAYDKIALVQYW